MDQLELTGTVFSEKQIRVDRNLPPSRLTEEFVNFPGYWERDFPLAAARVAGYNPLLNNRTNKHDPVLMSRGQRRQVYKVDGFPLFG